MAMTEAPPPVVPLSVVPPAAARVTVRPGGFRPARLPSALYASGMIAIYLGERILESGAPSHVATILGSILVLAALGMRIGRAGSRPADERAAERALTLLYVAGVAALLLYFINSNVLFYLTGKTLEQRMPRVSTVVGALWPALWLCATLPVVFVEMSLGAMAKSPLLDQGRVRAAMLSGLGLSFALVFSFAVTYVTSERDIKKDLSFFRTAKAGESTKKIVRALDKPVNIYLFFPPANEVREEVDSYFSDLTHESKMLIVEHFDHALHPGKAKDLNVSGNGIVVVARDTVKEQIPLPLQLEAARSQLKVLDQEVNKRLLGVTRKAKIGYITAGHEERTVEPMGDTDKRGGIRNLKSMLVDQGFEIKDLSMAQGLGTEVPADAMLVIIAGPRKPFLPEEEAAINRYIDRKGRVLIALDPENGPMLTSVLAQLGLKYNPTTLAHAQYYWNRTYQKADRVNVATASYSSHASVSTVQRMGARAALIVLGSGYLEKDNKGTVGIVNTDFTVHTDPGTWNDLNGNLEHDEKTEFKNTYEIAAAITKRNASALGVEEEGRAVVVADSDFLTDPVLGNLGNAYLTLDAVKWLAGEEQISGQISNEEDVPIAHTRKQDLVWFYLSIVGAPTLVLAVGFAMNRKRRKARAAKPSAAAAAPALPPPPAPPAPPTEPQSPTGVAS